MSNRTKVNASTSNNPVTKFLEWKSNDRCFSYYDKLESKNVQVELPFKFLFLDQLHTVKGWNDASASGIYSNEVKFIGKEPLTVKAFKGGEIAKGFYSEIKDKVKNAGGHYVKSVYIMLENGELANIQLKGSAVQQWGEFSKEPKRLSSEWISVKKVIEGKKGAVKYTTPDFEFDGELTDTQTADDCFDILEAYLKSYLTKVEVVAEPEAETDDLDF